MKSYFSQIAGQIILAGLIAFSGMPAFASKKVALVIGNGAYAEAPLKNPSNDARAVATTLRLQGFEVLLKENVGRVQLLDAVSEFGEKLSEGDTALFFFAGHGMQVQGRNYLIPTDAKITSEQRVRLETLDVEAVLDQMAAARARVSMVILDACRNNPFERRFRSAGGGLAQINAPEGTMIAYATSPGKVAADGEGANGLYTQELLKALRQPGLKVEDVFKQVRIGVSRASNGAQVPWEASSLTGDFFFQPPLAGSADATVSRETVFWDSVRVAQDPNELRAYLDAYPQGTFAADAKSRIAQLEAERPQQAAAATARAPAAGTNRTGRADIGFNGIFMTNVPAGVLGHAGVPLFASIERGVLRLNGSMPAGTNSQATTCLGQNSVGIAGEIDSTEIDCGTGLKAKLAGKATAGKEIRATITAANGQKIDVVFR